MQVSVEADRLAVSAEDDRALTSIFTAYTATATIWLVFATAVGLLLAYCVIARSCGIRLYSTRLAWIGLAPFNVAATRRRRNRRR